MSRAAGRDQTRLRPRGGYSYNCGVLLPLALAIALVTRPAPPFTDQQRQDLLTARDDADYREQAFYALVENARAWAQSPAVEGEAIRLAPDLHALLERPADFRGDLCSISGEVVQQTQLAPPYEDVSEWFVRRGRGGEAVIVYVVQPDRAIANRQNVQIDARFYKRMHFTARDRQPHDYPAFVGRFPTRAVAGLSAAPTISPATAPAAHNRGLDVLAVIAGPVALLMIVFVGMRRWIARKGRGGWPALHRERLEPTHDPQQLDAAESLPDDPAEALAELRRRAEPPRERDARDQSQSVTS